jgi:hypothetical protein
MAQVFMNEILEGSEDDLLNENSVAWVSNRPSLQHL